MDPAAELLVGLGLLLVASMALLAIWLLTSETVAEGARRLGRWNAPRRLHRRRVRLRPRRMPRPRIWIR